MVIDLRAIGKQIAGVMWVGVRAFFVTLFLVAVLGFILTVLSVYLLKDHHWGLGMLVILMTGIETVIVGVVLAFKRSVTKTVTHGLQTFRVGESMVRVVFDRMIGTPQNARTPEVIVVQHATDSPPPPPPMLALPSGEKLDEAVQEVKEETAQQGGFRARFQSRILDVVRKLTGDRLRKEQAKGRPVDVPKLREEIAKSMDEAIVKRFRGGLRLWTWIAMLGFPLLAALQAFLIYFLAPTRN